jgi:hypothetical protein
MTRARRFGLLFASLFAAAGLSAAPAAADLANALTLKEFRPHPNKVLYATIADAIVECSGGQRLRLTGMLAQNQNDPGSSSTVAVAALLPLNI